GALGVTPSGPLNPSNPPGSAPIATGFRVGDTALLLWLTTLGLDDGWYDTRTGQRVDGPQHTMGWSPAEPVPDCFQALFETTLPDGDLLDTGWLIGPAGAVVMTQGTTATSAHIARWAP